MEQIIEQLLADIKDKLTLEGRKKVFDKNRELSSNDLIELQNPEDFTREYFTDKILFDYFKVKRTGPKKFKTADGSTREVDYAIKSEINRILIEAKPINADLYDNSPQGGVNQILGIFRLAEAKDKYDFGIATNGLVWIFIKEDNIEEFNLKKDMKIIRRYINGEIKLRDRKLEDISNKFYSEYNDLLHGTKQISEDDCLVNSIKTVESEEDREEIAQIIVDRLIFIKFLQSKGIIKEDVLNYLHELEEHDLNLKLNQLFFEVMNTKENERGSIDPNFVHIPYLNGSLFERLDVEKRNTNYKVKARILKRIIEFLNKFKFVHHESIENNKDIIDPEILGYIFERAMTAKDRKGTGAYYTPKEITKYIAENSIFPLFIEKINTYLIKEKGYKKSELLTNIETIYDLRETTLREIWQNIILEINICDNACGSGAFLLATANILFEINKRIAYELKGYSRVKDTALKKLILKSLFGVDINPRAIEIAMLRLWLWLVESYEPEKIEPLPNIEYNLRVGNSLIGYLGIEKFGATIVTLDDFIESEETAKLLLIEFKNLKYEYQKSIGSEARQLRKDIENIREKIKNRLDKEYYQELRFHNIEIEKEDFFKLKPFHWGFEFYEIFNLDLLKEKRGFDIVIGNPPYVDSEYMVKYQKPERDILVRTYKTTKGNWDLYIPFYERGFNIINADGAICYITPNKWLSIGYGKSLRDFLINYLVRVCGCDKIRVFEEAGNSPVITFFEKVITNLDGIAVDYFEEDYSIISKGSIIRSIIDSKNWGILLSKDLNLLLKIKGKKHRLKEICDVENPFTVSEAYELKKLIYDGERISPSDLKLINTGTIDKHLPLWGRKTTSYIKNKYKRPFVKAEDFKKDMPKRYAQSISQKIIISGMRYFECILDIKGEYVAGKSTIIIRNPRGEISLEVINPILNSKLISFFMRNAYRTAGIQGGVNFTSTMIEDLPMPSIRKIAKKKELLLSYNNEIMKLTSRNDFLDNKEAKKKVENLMLKVDKLVYKLYEISPEDQQVIEQSL